MAFDSGPIMVRKTGGPLLSYEEYTVTNLYVERTFGASCHAVTVSNDSTTDTVSLSWNGSALIADLKAGETLELTVKGQSGVYVRGAVGGDKVRIWGT